MGRDGDEYHTYTFTVEVPLYYVQKPEQHSDVIHLCYRSWHLMKAVVGVDAADTFCHHLCPNPSCGHVFPDLERAEWEGRADECCPQCGCARFKHVAGRLAPAKRHDLRYSGA